MLFVCSCFDSNREIASTGRSFNTVVVDDVESVDLLKAEDVIHDYQLIVLETTPESIVGEVHKVIFAKSRVFVLDISKSKSVFVFNQKGEFLHRIGLIGQGPGEYIEPMDMAVDSINNEVIIYDQGTKKLLFYDLQGNFKMEKSISLFLRSLEYIDDKTILGFSHNALNIGNDHQEYPYDLLVFDKEGNIIRKYLFNDSKIGKGVSILTKNKYFSRNNSNIYVSYLLNDTIYSIENEYQPIPKYVLDFGSKGIKKEDFKSQDRLLEHLVNDERRGIWRPVQVTDNNMLISYTKGIDVVNPEENHRILIQYPDTYTCFKDLFFEDLKWSFPVSSSGEYFVSVILPEKITSAKQKELGIKEMDNPVLLLYNFKKK